jgi:hypothetical protein
MTVSEGGDLTMTGSGSFGLCYSTQFLTLSDMMNKRDIREWRSPVLSDFQRIHPYIFKNEGLVDEDIGFLADEIGSIWPQLIKKGRYVNYDGVVALLLKAVQELTVRVVSLERQA